MIFSGSSRINIPLEINKLDSFSRSFAHLPDVVLFNIFSYLCTDDIARAGRVCLRWYYISRCQILWKYVNIHGMELTPYQVQKLLPTLPSCVSYIRICSLYCPRKQPDPIFTSENAKKLKEFCPHLETLIIENAFLATYKTVTDIAVENLPQKVCVLSLRGSIFRTHYFFSNVNTCQNIKILDFSSCICIRDNHLGCFSKMRSLEELYLAGCQIHNQGIKILLDTSEKSTVLRLKVLDLEATEITDEIIMVLQERLFSLEKLFLRRTQITDDSFAFVDKYTFEKLNTLCLQDTNMTSAGIRPLLKLKSIKFINLSVEVLKSSMLEIHPALRRVLSFKNEEAADSLFCDHFMKRNICAFQ